MRPGCHIPVNGAGVAFVQLMRDPVGDQKVDWEQHCFSGHGFEPQQLCSVCQEWQWYTRNSWPTKSRSKRGNIIWNGTEKYLCRSYAEVPDWTVRVAAVCGSPCCLFKPSLSIHWDTQFILQQGWNRGGRELGTGCLPLSQPYSFLCKFSVPWALPALHNCSQVNKLLKTPVWHRPWQPEPCWPNLGTCKDPRFVCPLRLLRRAAKMSHPFLSSQFFL